MTETLPLNSVQSVRKVWYRHWRIVRSDDENYPFASQYKVIWFPFCWLSTGWTHKTLDAARSWIAVQSWRNTLVQKL